jgi:hypothetical protein
MADADSQISQQSQQDTKVETPAPAPAPPMMGAAISTVGPQMVMKKLAARRNAEEKEEKTQGGDPEHAGEGGGGGGGNPHKPNLKGGNEDQIADEIISQSRPMELPYRAKMEKSFGTHFEGVKAHQSDRTHEIHAEAFVKGKDIVFASDHPDEGIVAHELTHIVQSHGGTQGVMTFAAGSAGALEMEADAVAETVVSGGQAQVQMTTGGSSGGIHKWGGSDHYMLGNLGGQKALSRFRSAFPDAAKNLHTQKSDVAHVAPGDASQSGIQINKDEETLGLQTAKSSGFFGGGPAKQIGMGDASRFAGDYVTSPDGLKGKNPDDLVGKTKDVGMVFGASTNAQHFFPLNAVEYQNHHEKAVGLAAGGNIDAAMIEEGFANHFLQDTHASGHMAPRSLDSVEHMKNSPTIKSTLTMIAAPIVGMGSKAAAFGEDAYKGLARSKQWHDFFCMLPNGLPTTMGRFHGDDYMDGHDLEYVSNMSADSIMEVLTASQKGKEQRFGIPGRIPKPAFDQIIADPIAGPAWKLMMNDYQADLKKAHETIKAGDKGVTDGGSEFDSQKALDDIQKYTFGGQPNGDAVTKAQGDKATSDANAGQNNPLAYFGKTANDARTQLAGGLQGLKHYLVATFGFNIHTGLDDDVKQVSGPQDPHTTLPDLEKNFHLVGNVEKFNGQYKDALSGYDDHVKKGTLGDDGAKVGKQIADELKLSADLTTRIALWKQIIDQSGGILMTGQTKKKTALAKQIADNVGPVIEAITPFQPLPLNAPQKGNAVAPQAGAAKAAG